MKNTFTTFLCLSSLFLHAIVINAYAGTFAETTTLSVFAFVDSVESNAANGESLNEDTVIVSTIAELRDQVDQGTVTFTGEAILTFQQEFRNQKFIQDDTAGILIRV